MPASNHRPGPLARLALAGGGVTALLAVAYAAFIAVTLTGSTLAGIVLIGAVFAGCGLVSRERFRQRPHLTRPADAPADSELVTARS